MPRSIRLAAVLLLLAAAGCARFRQPTVTLESVALGGIGFTGGTLLVDVKVVNPNRFDLRTDRLVYDLAVRRSGSSAGDEDGWIDFASGTHEDDIVVEARDSATVRIPVEFSYRALGDAAESLLRAGRFDYRASGTVHARTPLGSREVPFRKRGTFTMTTSR